MATVVTNFGSSKDNNQNHEDIDGVVTRKTTNKKVHKKVKNGDSIDGSNTR